MRPLHLAAALLMVSIWGFNFVVMRWGLDQVPPLTLSLLRFALAAFPALLLVPRPQVPWHLLAIYGLFAFACQFGLLFSGMAAGMPAGLASLVIQIQAFFTIALAAWLQNDRPRLGQLGGALLAGAGLALVASQLPGGSRLGMALVVLAALSWAVANLVVKRIALDATAGPRAPLAIVVWGCVWSLPPLALLALVLEGPTAMLEAVVSLDAGQWVGVAFQAWPTTLLAFAIWAALLRRYPAGLVAPFTLLVPVVGISSAVALLGEPLAWWKLAGAALVLGGLALNVNAYRRS